MAAHYRDRLKDAAMLKGLAEQDRRWGEAEQPAQFTPEFLQKIGIYYEGETAGAGYIKLLYPDFIVEELTDKNEIVSIAPGPFAQADWDAPTLTDPAKKLRLEAEMVKQGFSTFEALERLAEALNLEMSQITYAGLKDGKAITAQRVCLNNTTREQLANVTIPNLFFKNSHYRVGMRNTGELLGNRFTILVRTDEIKPDILDDRLETIRHDGFLNFFSLQRFGNRLLTHKIGKFILFGHYDSALRLFLTGQSPHELRILQTIRTQAEDVWGNWSAMEKLYSQFPYFFQNELKAVRALVNEPGNPFAALKAVEDQIKMSVNAYHSYCFNVVLSIAVKERRIPETLELLNPHSVSWYSRLLPQEKFSGIRWRHPQLLWLGESRRKDIPTRVRLNLHPTTRVEPGIIFHFDLPKGAYATTFLADLFKLFQGRPVPAWVNQNPFDTRQILGYPPVTETESAFPTASFEDLSTTDD